MEKINLAIQSYINPVLLSVMVVILGAGVSSIKSMAIDINEIKIQLAKQELNSINFERRINKLEDWKELKQRNEN